MNANTTTTGQDFFVAYEPRGTWGVRNAYFATREEAVAFIDANGEGHASVNGFSTYIRYDDNTVGFDNA